MCLQIRYLTVRKGKYVFRMAIPHRLQDSFAKREIKRVIAVHSLKEAAFFCKIYAAEIKKLFILVENVIGQ